MRKWYRHHDRLHGKLGELLKGLYGAFGMKTRIVAPLFGRYIFSAMHKEEKRLANGWTMEPTTFYHGKRAVACSPPAAGAALPEAATVSAGQPTGNLIPALVDSRQ